MPRFCSISIQSDVAARRPARALTAPASPSMPAYSRNFSVSVVLPASGWLMIANVRRRAASTADSDIPSRLGRLRRFGERAVPAPRFLDRRQPIARRAPQGAGDLGADQIEQRQRADMAVERPDR